MTAPSIRLELAGPHRSSRASGELLLALAILAALSVAALGVCLREGYILFYGDAEAHLNIARRILDSRTPGLRQVGTVWLPLPHLLMLPFVQDDELWRTGLAGAIPSAVSYVIAGLFLFASARRLFGAAAPAFATLIAFALNPNLLYLQSTPMTEAIFFAGECAVFYFVLRFRESPQTRWVLAAGAATIAASLTRYEGWFLIPFVTAFLGAVAPKRRLQVMALYGLAATVGPLLWLAHNAWFWGDPFEFYRGAYSAKAIYQRSLATGGSTYPGDHDWATAAHYYFDASKACLGWPLIGAGAAGLLAVLGRKQQWPILLLLCAPLFYVWVVHSGSIPIFVPELWPHAAYNTRYGLAALPCLALCTGALVANVPLPWRAPTVSLAGLIVGARLLLAGRPDDSICWQEARATSEARRSATQEAAAFLKTHYHPGDGIVMCFGDLTGVLREAGIPLRETLIQDNVQDWKSVNAAPASHLREGWALTSSGDQVGTLLGALGDSGPRFQCLDSITEKGGPTLQIFRRG
ncbi:MAG: glycosyltransferase family 39 protein [Deltaproteobacteria bacterium]|nr:glycosyltransferase family 39 protein [Deltaproteobacteria bacterium]